MNFTNYYTMDPLRQPKKRFVGRRAADAQVSKDPAGDVESTTVQKGMGRLPLSIACVLII